jgi:hypothetical protein
MSINENANKVAADVMLKAPCQSRVAGCLVDGKIIGAIGMAGERAHRMDSAPGPAPRR